MKCSKCGYERQSRDDAFVPISECPACGVVYAKHDSTKKPDESVNAIRPPHLKPSPVDAISLRKARERVDKRLRERLGTRVQDDRHAQTLKLAKRLTSEQLRKRQDEWKLTHADEQPLPEASVPADLAQETHPVHADTDRVPNLQTANSMDHEPMDATRTEVEKMTPAGARPRQTVDSTTPAVEQLPTPADESQSIAAEVSSADEEVVLLQDAVQDAVMDSADQPSAAIREETPQNLEGNRQDIGEALPEPESAIPAAHIASTALQHKYKIGLPRLLPVIAWLILCAGVIGAVLSWTTIGDVQAGVRIPIPESMSSLPLGLLLGFAYLATGVLGFAFFWVSSLISIQLKDIRQLLISEERGGNATQDEETEQ
jgi:hypothetical protein